LAGDHLKTASDLGVPIVGVGLLYQQGYFRQMLDAQGRQQEFYPYNDPNSLPISPSTGPGGDRLRIELDLPGRKMALRVWQVKVGRVKLYLLDSNDPLNSPMDRGITGDLYGGGREIRLLQEMLLGIGGWRALVALGIQPAVLHLNEGHAAFATLERVRSFMETHDADFEKALWAIRAGNVFTTHTPVPAGFDEFDSILVSRYFRNYASTLGISLDRMLALGRKGIDDRDGLFNMTYLALRTSGAVNAVSQLHGRVSQRIFQPLYPRWPETDIPVGYVTNGVHVPSWDSPHADEIWTRSCGKTRWLCMPQTFSEQIEALSDDHLWKFRNSGRQQLVDYVRRRLAFQTSILGADNETIDRVQNVLDPNTLTLGFARRFAAYKRPNLLLQDEERLIRLLTDPVRPIQLVVAGKAHPRDEEGKRMVQRMVRFAHRPEIRNRIVFLADYDMLVAERLVQGVDLWVNTPQRPWEACGTSGMKVLGQHSATPMGSLRDQRHESAGKRGTQHLGTGRLVGGSLQSRSRLGVG
jgi:starch phosphorylase